MNEGKTSVLLRIRTLFLFKSLNYFMLKLLLRALLPVVLVLPPALVLFPPVADWLYVWNIEDMYFIAEALPF